MKTLKPILIFALIACLAACASKQTEPIPPEPVSQSDVSNAPETPEVEIYEEIQEEEVEEELLDDGFLDEPEVLIIEEQDEYSRSLGELDSSVISEETFAEDKEDVLKIIADLDEIMRLKDYSRWLKYISLDSKAYWTDAQNLAVLSEKLPSSKLYTLKNMRDYFERFFIPARKGRVIDEIRYVTPDLIKAVQYKDNEDIIYYRFERSNGTWLLQLDTNTEEEE